MPVYVYKVTETTDAGAFIRQFLYGMTDGYNDYTGATVSGTQQAEDFTGLWFQSLANGQEYSGGEGYSAKYSSFIGKLSLSNWIQLSGMPCRDIDNLTVGRRFYFADGLYVRISEIRTYTQYGQNYISVSWQYYKNNILVGTIQIPTVLHSTIDTSYASSMRVYAIPLIPYDAPHWEGGRITLPHSYAVGQYFNIYTGSGPYVQISAGPGFQVSPAWLQTFFSGVEPVDTNDPYINIEDSDPSGPAEGVGYPEDDLVPIPSLPSVSVVDTGFVTLFNPSLSQVKALASYMWAGLFDVATFKKIFADPMDCILGFNMLPVAIPNGGTAEVVVGNISTGVSMTKAAGQWVELDCGSVTIDKPFGNYLDWSPYMKWSIYLPYIGTVDLSTDDIMGHTIHLVYHVDVLSCACVAYLEVDGRVMYQWTGSCGYSIPVTGENFRQMIANIVNIAANLGGAIATGGMTAPLAIASAASVTQNVMSSKPEVHRSGAIGSSAGMLGMQKPYLIQQGPKICKPEKQYHYLGYPAFVTVQLGNVSGYQEFSNVILDGIPCTEEERDMITAACEGGIYL